MPDAASNRAQICARLGNRDAITHPAHNLPVMPGAAGTRRIQLARNPRGNAGGEVESRRHYAHNRVGSSFEVQVEFREISGTA